MIRVYAGKRACGCYLAAIDASRVSRRELAEALGEMVLNGLAIETHDGPVRLAIGGCTHDAAPTMEKGKTYHMAVSVDGLLAKSDRALTNAALTDDDGRAVSGPEARRKLEEMRDRGVRVFPAGGCDNFDPQGGCRGH